MRRWLGLAALVVYVGTIVGANWAIKKYGPVPVGFGLLAPAGVFFAGVAFTARDAVQEAFGRVPVVAAIVAGAALSAMIDRRFAVASGVAFLVSEVADFGVWTPLRNRNLLAALAISNVVGLVADSILFLWLAFGSLAFLPGQIVGKLWTTIPAAGVLLARDLLARYSSAQLA